jgi:hypothetical protein
MLSVDRVSLDMFIICLSLIEGSLEAKLPTIWTVDTQSREEAERREKSSRKKR